MADDPLYRIELEVPIHGPQHGVKALELERYLTACANDFLRANGQGTDTDPVYVRRARTLIEVVRS